MSEELLNENTELPEDQETATKETTAGVDQSAEETKPKGKFYTNEEINGMISRRLERERARVAKAIGEEQQLSDLEIREKKILERELKADVKAALADQGYPAALADIVNYESEEVCNKQLEQITKTFQDAVNQGIKSALSGRPPKDHTVRISEASAVANAFKPPR